MRRNGRIGDDERLGILVERAECGTEPLDRSRSDAHVAGLMARDIDDDLTHGLPL